ncbi:MAG: hypothetical protein GC191_01680 [Azospirillum sp.]|nr:hypothetical protein [Azospirillum sp.]
MTASMEVLAAYPAPGGALRGVIAGRARPDPGRPFLVCRDRAWSWCVFKTAAIAARAAPATA